MCENRCGWGVGVQRVWLGYELRTYIRKATERTYELYVRCWLRRMLCYMTINKYCLLMVAYLSQQKNHVIFFHLWNVIGVLFHNRITEFFIFILFSS